MKRLIPLFMLCCSSTLIAAQETETGVELSPSTYAVFSEWAEGPETNLSLKEAVVELERFDLVGEWLSEVSVGEGAIGFREYLQTTAPRDLVRWEEDLLELKLNPADDALLAGYALAMDETRFENYESEQVLAGKRSLTQFVERVDPVFHANWDAERIVPARTMPLRDWLIGQGELVPLEAWCELMHSRLIGIYDSRCGGPPPPPPPPPSTCECSIVYTISGTPTGFVSQSQWLQNESKRKKRYWSEQWQAAHYMEAYVYGKGKKMNVDKSTLQRINETKIRARLQCLEDGKECGNECRATLHVYNDYHSRVQVHTDTWGLFGGKSEATSSDQAKLLLDGNGGQLTLFNKAVAIKQTSEKKFKLDKAVELANALVQIGAAVFGKGDPTQIPKLTATAVKNFKGVIEVKGKQGSNTADMRANFDSVQAIDPIFFMLANEDWVATTQSNGQIAYEGEGRNKTENSYYGSSNALALAINEFACPSDVKPPPPIGIWSHSEAYRSPFHGTTNNADNLRAFLSFVLPSSTTPPTTSNTGAWTP